MPSKDRAVARDEESVSLARVVDSVQEFFIAQFFVIPLRCRISGLLPLGIFTEITSLLGSRRDSASSVVHQHWRTTRQHIVRMRAGRTSPAFSLVSEFRPVRGCAWKCCVVRPCCRRRCRQTATCVRAAEWASAGVLPGLGSGMVRGPYAGPATRAGRDPARNLNEWPPGLARRGPRPGEVGKAHGADRPQRRAAHRPTLRRRFAVGLALAVRARPVFFALPVAAALPLRGLVAGRPAVAEPRAGRVGGRAARDPRQRVALKT